MAITIYTSNKLIFCKDRNTGYDLGKNDAQALFQILVELMVSNIVFLNRIVDEWSGLPNHIRESNS